MVEFEFEFEVYDGFNSKIGMRQVFRVGHADVLSWRSPGEFD